MRLIDADALKERLKEYCVDGDSEATEWYKMMGIDEEIDDAPTVDAVKVVRCKDCEYWGLNRTWLKDGEVYVQDCFVNQMMTKPDFFCAGGDKRVWRKNEANE